MAVGALLLPFRQHVFVQPGSHRSCNGGNANIRDFTVNFFKTLEY